MTMMDSVVVVRMIRNAGSESAGVIAAICTIYTKENTYVSSVENTAF